VPALFDLDAMREGWWLGATPTTSNPLNPVDLVIDTSVMTTNLANPRDGIQMKSRPELKTNSERVYF